jgi:hypothetical protein
MPEYVAAEEVRRVCRATYTLSDDGKIEVLNIKTNKEFTGATT